MKPVKPFEQFLNESKSSDFSHAVLIALEPTIIDMVENIKAHIIEEYTKRNQKYAISEFEAKLIRLSLIVDMLKSFEKYTEPTDKLVTIHASTARKGISINAVIERDGQQYTYYTEAIGAGGYNIQSYHYRYLTKTKLPNAKIKGTLADEYAQELKKLSKAEKLNLEIKGIEDRIKTLEEQIQSNLALTDEEIIKIVSEPGYGTTPTGGWFASQLKPLKWDELGDEQKKRFGSKSELEKYNKEETEGAINWWRTRNIKWKQDSLKSSQAEIKKLTSKLEQLSK